MKFDNDERAMITTLNNGDYSSKPTKNQKRRLIIKTIDNFLQEAYVTIEEFKMHQMTMNRTSLMVCFDSNTTNEEQ